MFVAGRRSPDGKARVGAWRDEGDAAGGSGISNQRDRRRILRREAKHAAAEAILRRLSQHSGAGRRGRDTGERGLRGGKVEEGGRGVQGQGLS